MYLSSNGRLFVGKNNLIGTRNASITLMLLKHFYFVANWINSSNFSSHKIYQL